MTVDPERFAWMIPFSATLLPAFLGLFTGIVTLVTFKLPIKITSKIIAFAALWIAVEGLRSVILTGFPWNLIGYVWAFSATTIQITSLIGIYGLGFFTVIAATLPSLYLLDKSQKKPLFISLAIALFIVIFGILRLELAGDTRFTEHKIRIVQANIPQKMKWAAEERYNNLSKHIELSAKASDHKFSAIIWPESALPFVVSEQTPFYEFLGGTLDNSDYLITGAVSVDESQNEVFNSLIAINHNMQIADKYHKFRLVPFGEFMPLRGILPVDKLTPGTKDFSRGSGQLVVKLANLPPFIPLICYEGIFTLNPGTVANAEWLLNTTNDGWFGTSSGPYQHLAMERVRAVESGLPLVRAANTGISAVYDGMGREINYLELNAQGVIDSKLPARLERSPYSEYGYLIIAIIAFLSGLYILIVEKR